MIRSIDLETCACTNMVQATFSVIQSLCGSADGSTVYVGADSGHIHSWFFGKDAAGKELTAWKAHSAHVLQMKLWHKRLISTSEDRTIRIWNPADGHLLEEFYGHAGAILSCAVLLRDKQLWTGSRDHSVRSWDLLEAERCIDERAMFASMDRDSLQFRKDYAKMMKDKKKRGGGKKKDKSPSRKKSPKR